MGINPINEVTVRPRELATAVEHFIDHQYNMMIVGAPGIGKSDIVAQGAGAAGARLIVSHPVVSDPTDFKGLPFMGPDGKAKFIAFNDLLELCETREKTVYFLDDLGQAPPSVQNACMQLLLNRAINGHRVSDTVTFMAATNRKEDKAGVSGIMEPVKSRFMSILHLAPDADDWCAWANANDMPPELISFIRYMPDFVVSKFEATTNMTNSPCPRTIAHVGRLINSGLPESLERASFVGAAGQEFATQFIGFLHIFRNLPDPDKILADPEHFDVPVDTEVLYALTGAISHRAKKSNMDKVKAFVDRLEDAGKVEFSIATMKNVMTRDPSLVKTAASVKWIQAHNRELID